MPEEDLSETEKLAFDYAWNWFDFHGKQRMQLFNYFLIITGILATAYVTALDKKLYSIGIAVCLLGIIQSVGFIIFDIRNRDLTERAEKALHAFEHKNALFEGYKYKEQDIEICLPDSYNSPKFKEMKTWIWIIEGGIIISFILGIIYASRLLSCPPISQ